MFIVMCTLLWPAGQGLPESMKACVYHDVHFAMASIPRPTRNFMKVTEGW